MAAAAAVTPEGTALALERMRELSPLVQCITNFVSMDIMANTLLAAGASPAMVRIAWAAVRKLRG
jgi:hydroxyethylthiazole kinase-like sugar kinase family protein